MISHVSFIILVHQIVILSLLTPTKLTITKIHHLIRLIFERSEHKSPSVQLVAVQNLIRLVSAYQMLKFEKLIANQIELVNTTSDILNSPIIH